MNNLILRTNKEINVWVGLFESRLTLTQDYKLTKVLIFLL